MSSATQLTTSKHNMSTSTPDLPLIQLKQLTEQSTTNDNNLPPPLPTSPPPNNTFINTSTILLNNNYQNNEPILTQTFIKRRRASSFSGQIPKSTLSANQSITNKGNELITNSNLIEMPKRAAPTIQPGIISSNNTTNLRTPHRPRKRPFYELVFADAVAGGVHFD
jgi:hypothetical protein